MTAELMAGWRYALPGHFFVPRAFFAVKLPPHSRTARNAATTVLVASRWHCGMRVDPLIELADVDRLMLSTLSSWL